MAEVGEKIRLRNELQTEKNDDFEAKIETSSKTIQVPYYNLFQHSQIIQEEIKQFGIFDRLITRFHEFHKSSNIDDESIETFFQFLNNDEIEIKEEEFSNLMKLSNFFKVETLSKCLKEYFENHSNDVDLIIRLKIQEEQNDDLDFFINDEISLSMEECLENNINECLQNVNFRKLSISSIHRIIEIHERKQNEHEIESISSDLLYRFIIESIEERCVLFKFLKVEELSDELFEDISIKYDQSHQNERKRYFDYLPSNFKYINKLREKQKLLLKQIEDLEKKQIEIAKENDELKAINEQQKTQMTNEMKEKEKEINELKTMNEQQKTQMANEMKEKEKEINELKATNEQQMAQMTNEMKEKEKEINELYKLNEQYETRMNEEFEQKNKKADEISEINQQIESKMKDELNQKEKEIDNLKEVLEKMKIDKDKGNKYSVELIKELLTRYGDISNFEICGVHQNMLHYAIKTGNYYFVQSVLSLNKIDINSKSISNQIF